ncbi:MAG: DNA-(Apurinic or apyrimidinic site) lyase [Candidatus Woesebacteria bacterium GW2011_GWA1_37_7]|uniref:DNA-(Apurinic or apyrimidinic site) lyase n=1 Tax=Candidatus Woesebacteria bacterium GW2011_GWA1_37_7 TaxID=1618545 RepID=A0A0G0HCT3_9BACT|nr:MAG: DNA-(Apurinic or apyrimidinic site) lyase [Candidatus Woesebacteria bacterium GW2011_GWA1_37_7]
MTNNFDKVFILFKKNYVQVPLEVFEKDAYKTLISTLLSSRTNDKTTHAASFRLFKKAANVNALKNLKTNELKNLIYPVGFYKTKAKHLTNLAEIIIRDFSGEVPQTREELMTLPGVGRKTANLVLNRAFGIPAIAVDTHVHRISNMLGWVSTNTPEQTESELVKILPRKYWRDINRLFVSIGRQFTSKKKLDGFLRSNKLV